MITAVKTIIDDPTFNLRYREYVNSASEGVDRARMVAELERSLATLFGGSARGGNQKLVPDIAIDDNRFSAALSKVFQENIEEGELKLKRGGRRTSIGGARITGAIKEAALASFGESAKELTQTRVSALNAAKGARLFEALRSDPSLFSEFYNKSRFLNIVRQIGTGPAEVLSLFIPKSDFKIPPLVLRYSKSEETIFLSLDTPFEKEVLKQLSTVPQARIAELSARELAENFEKLRFKDVSIKTTAKKANQFKLRIPTGGSIPVRKIKAKVPTKQRRKDDRVSAISDAQMTALVQRETERRMPKGPERGPPLSSTVLTYRSGQFVDSIRVIQNIKTNLITYYYAPNYKVHEKRGARAPRILLQGSIRDTVRAVYGERFRIVRGF